MCLQSADRQILKLFVVNVHQEVSLTDLSVHSVCMLVHVHSWMGVIARKRGRNVMVRWGM